MERHTTYDRRTLLRAAGAAGGATVTGALFGTAAATGGDRATADHFEVGAARVEASPLEAHLEEGVYLGGFGVGPVREAEGIHDGCFARSIAITVDDETSVLTMLDLVGIGNVQIDAIREEASDRTGVDEERILVGASHTHSGPDFQGLWGGVPESYREYLIERTATAIETAVERRQPATARVGSVDAPELSRNRRGWGETTETLSALQFEAIDRSDPERAADEANERRQDDDGDVIATLVSYAAHQVVIGSGNQLVATDYVGPLERSLEETYGGVVSFFPGAIGDASPAGYGGETDFEQAENYGEKLADRTRDALDEAESVEPGLLARSDTVRLPLDNCVFRAAFAIGLLRPYYHGETPSGVAADTAAGAAGEVSEDAGDAIAAAGEEAPGVVPLAIHSPVARLSLGADGDPVELLTIPGEGLTRLGHDLEDIADADHRFLLGLTQNSLGYLVPQDEWNERDDPYEETVSMGPDTAPLYRNGARELFGKDPEPFERSDVDDRTCPAAQAEFETWLDEQFANLQHGEMAASVCCSGEGHGHALSEHAADD